MWAKYASAALTLLAAPLISASLYAAEPPKTLPKADPAAAQQIVSGVCAACHGIDGNSVIATNPKLAGQHAAYLTKQLTLYKNGQRKNAVMNGMAAGLSDADIRNLAAYFSTQKPKEGTARNPELVALGQKIYRGGIAQTGVAACMACHSPNGSGIPAPYPRIAGQHSEYTITQLKAYRAGERNYEAALPMLSIAAKLSDKEIAAVAEYISGLK